MELKINKINNWFRSVTDSTNDFGLSSYCSSCLSAFTLVTFFSYVN